MPYGDGETYKDPKKAKEMVFEAQEKSEKALEPLYKTQWRRNELLYYGKHDAGMWESAMGATHWMQGSPYESHLFVPTVLQQVEMQTPKLALSLLANDPMVRALPVLRDGEMSSQAQAWMEAQAKEQWLHHQCVRDVRLRSRLSPWLRDTVKHGTYMLSLDWMTREGPNWEQIEKTRTVEGHTYGTGVWEFTEATGKKIEDRLRVTGNALWDIFPDPRGQAFREEHGRVCRYVVRRIIMDVDDLIGWIKATPTKPWWFQKGAAAKKGQTPKKGDWIAQLKALKGQVKGKHNRTACILAEVGRLAKDQGKGFRATEQDEKLIVLHDYWEPAGGYHILVAGTRSNGLTLLMEENPFKLLGLPFVALRPIPLANQLYGLGIVDMIEHLVYWINALTNLHLTGAIREANPLVIIDAMSGISAQDLMAEPYLVKEVDGTVPPKDCVHVQPFQATAAAAFQEREYAQQQLQATAGTGDFQMLGDPGKNTTARGIGQYLQQNAQRFLLAVHQAACGLAELAEAMDQLNRQFITGPRMFRYTDKRRRQAFGVITPEMIKRDVELEFDARPETANPELQAQQTLQWAQIWAQHPNFDVDEAIVESGRLLRIPRPERFLRQQFNRAELENEMFRESASKGEPYMGHVLPSDPHEEHIEIHDLIGRDGTVNMDDPRHVRAYAEHLTQHFRYLSPGAAGGGEAGGGAPAEGAPQPGPQAPAPAPAQGVTGG